MVAHSDPPSMNKAFIDTIISGLESSKTAIGETQKQVNSIDKSLAVMQKSQEDLQKSMDLLLKIIRDGNGKESLLDRVSHLENDNKIVGEFIKDNKTSKKETLFGKWQTRTAMITATLSLIGVIITALVNFYS